MSDDLKALMALLDSTAFLMPNFNDTFGYACADTEQIAVGESEIMATWWLRHGWHGLVAIAAWKRGLHPLRPIAEDERYLSALHDLGSDTLIHCTSESEGETWRWWFDLSDTNPLARKVADDA